ncbi:MAG: ABC transporter permease [Pirellulaceae bacterium]
MKRHWSDHITTIGLPLLVLVGVMALWQAIVTLGQYEIYLLPGPLDVADSMWQRRVQLLGYTFRTGTAAFAGFGLSLMIGVVVALLFSQSRLIRQSGYPYAIFFQTVPIVAIAPLVITLFGYGLVSVIVVATIISLFPIITSTTTGLITTDPGLVDLFRLNRASRWQVLWKLQFPGAIRYLVTGMKTSSGLAVVGAIVGEFFSGYGVGAQGLGYFIRSSSDNLNTPNLFAGMICSTLLGVGVFASIALVERFFLRRWIY